MSCLVYISDSLTRTSFLINLFCLSDEAALVKGACNLGYVFSSRTPDAVTIDVVSHSFHGILRYIGALSCVYSNVLQRGTTFVIYCLLP